MTGFDIIVLLLIGIAAIGGFLRGFVQEILSLAAWILTAFVIHALHTPVTAGLTAYIPNVITASLAAFALLLIVPYASVKLIANWLGEASRESLLGPIDRVLGFGFGALKGVIIVVIAFSILVLGYDTVWGPTGRPVWITTARTYPFVNTGSDELVQMIKQRRIAIEKRDSQLEKPAK